METALLKSFAIWARTALIREVAARIAVVLAPASPERVEQPSAVAALEKAVRAAGSGDGGRAAVADRVAYTWFNRVIALRFMDANGYTGISVVSPEQSREGGQPEVLGEAKRGNIDSTVIANKRTVEMVTSLLNGTRRSDDPQGEAYALLLTEYCRYWHRSMPFMFEREGDYTELLIPANLLADDSVLARAVAVLSEKVCQDVEVIGWLYQFYISERKDDVFAGFKKGKKAGAAEIPAATQLFTPHWIVRYLVENSLGRLWLLNRPASQLAEQMEYYIAPVDKEADYLKVSSPEELKIIDSACGSGHMLTYAFDLLYAIYEEEGYAPSDIPGLILAKNLYGAEIDPRAGALAAFALTMKARARQRTFFKKKVTPNICVLEPISFTSSELGTLVTRGGDRADEEAFWNQFKHADTFGSLIRPREALIEPLRHHVDANEPDGGDLIDGLLFERARRVLVQAEYLSARYHVVVANPPYMRSKNMDSRLTIFAKETYADSKNDLFAMFIERNRALASPRGYVAMVTMQSWMFLSGFEELRKKLLTCSSIRVVAHLGTGAFESIAGAVVSTSAFIIHAAVDPDSAGIYIRLANLPDESAKSRRLLEAIRDAAHSDRYQLSAVQISRLPGRTLSYWMSTELLDAFEGGTRLAAVADPRQGMATADNARFLRFWTEVSLDRIGFGYSSRPAARGSRRRWFPYNKGGSFRRWYGNQEYVVNWEDDGRELLTERPKSVIRSPQYYFNESVSWSKVGTAEPAFRYFPPGFLFDVAGTSMFTRDQHALRVLLAFGNSVVAREMLRASATSMNLEVGTIAELPVRVTASPELETIVDRLIEIYRQDWDDDERSWDFTILPVLASNAVKLQAGIAQILDRNEVLSKEARELEESVNRVFISAYKLDSLLSPTVAPEAVALSANAVSRFAITDPLAARAAPERRAVNDLVSYAVGCMFGRYSLDEPGLILANQGDTLQDYLVKVPNPSFMPDADNVIPIVDGEWFEDDIVARFRHFLRAAFGGQYFEEDLRLIADSLGVTNLRDYFVKSFYKDHVQRYKKRPIYWLFSSPKGSFNALIYMHRYNPSTVSTVLNEYLREFKAKLEASRQHHERLAAGAGTPRQLAAAHKEVDRLRKVMLELDEYEHDVLYPLAAQQVQIDLDDGVKANYPKFGAALKKITGLEASDE